MFTQSAHPIPSRARWLLPDEKFDEPALEPLGLTHITFPMIFLVVGLWVPFFIFIVETKGLTNTAAGQKGEAEKMTKIKKKQAFEN